MHNSKSHIPVLKQEVIAALNIKKQGVYLDATLGRAGHAGAICSLLGEQGRLIAIDRDPQAVKAGKEVFADDSRVKILHGRFADMDSLLQDAGLPDKLDGILLDLGVSSPQLDDAERGFSFMRDGELDMRMDTTQGMNAREWLAEVEETELANVIFRLGEERFSRRIARLIVETRAEQEITTTAQLAELVEQAMPRKEKHKHPATRTFQAIRLYINQELEQISETLPKAVQLLNTGGRLAVISFHSLEDRIVKRFIREQSKGRQLPRNIPIQFDDYQPPLKAIGKAIKPTAEELEYNPRARSAVLRVAERSEVVYAR